MNAQLLKKLSVITDEERHILDGGRLDLKAYSNDINSVLDSRKLLESGKLITIRPNTRFTAFPKHRHNYVEIVYMCSGSQKHIIGGTSEIILKQGELLLLNQHAYHETFYTGKDDIAVNFIILPAFFNEVIDIIGADNKLSDFIMSGLTRKESAISFMHFDVADVLPIQNLLENLIWSIVNKQPNRRNINQQTMGLLFLQLLGFTDRLISDEPQRFSTVITMAALSEIEQNYVNASLSSVAERFHVTSAYVSRAVSETTGKTFKRQLMEKRLSKAAELLEKTAFNINSIVAMTGYENTSYFYRIFTETYGMSPMNYRKRKVK